MNDHHDPQDDTPDLGLPEHRHKRVPTGRYPKLINTLRRLTVQHGVSVRVAARVFGLKQSTLSMRLTETDAFTEREARDLELSRHALTEEIARGTLTPDEFWHHFDEPWRDYLRSRGITPSWEDPNS